MTAKFKFINHACFTVSKNGKTLICDPYLDGNPEGLTVDDLKVDYIFISHAHFDHIGSAFELARRWNAQIISTAEIAGLAGENGCNAHGMHLGGTFKFPFGKVRVTLAFHGSGIAGGHACGFVIDFYGTKFYFAGDTALFSDMNLLQDLDPFSYALIPIGGNFTMDPNDAAIAAKFLRAKYIIPIHYNTWPPIKQDGEAFKARVESETASKVILVKPGDELNWE